MKPYVLTSRVQELIRCFVLPVCDRWWPFARCKQPCRTGYW